MGRQVSFCCPWPLPLPPTPPPTLGRTTEKEEADQEDKYRRDKDKQAYGSHKAAWNTTWLSSIVLAILSVVPIYA